MGLVEAVRRRAEPRRVAWSWAGFFAFSLLVFPLFDAVNGMPDAVTPLDLQFFHGPDAVAATLAELGDRGRAAYLRSLLIADVLWPIVYGTTLSLTIAWGRPGRRTWLWVPVAAVGLDFLENSLIAVQIVTFPDGGRWLAVLSSAASGAKWIAAGLATALALAALVGGLRRRRARAAIS